MKTFIVNETEVTCSHEIKTDEQHVTAVHVTVKAGDVELTHVMTVGAIDAPIPPTYDLAALQKDLDEFRQRHAELAEGKFRAKKLAEGLT